MAAGAPGKLVSPKAAEPATPLTEAVTVSAPALVFAVNPGATAKPFASVITWTDLPPLAKTPLAPPAGAVNVTSTSPTGLPSASTTRTARLVAKAVWTTADCGLPAVGTMLDGG